MPVSDRFGRAVVTVELTKCVQLDASTECLGVELEGRTSGAVEQEIGSEAGHSGLSFGIGAMLVRLDGEAHLIGGGRATSCIGR